MMMLQIIGWTLCAALFCWGMSIFGNANYQTEDAEGRKVVAGAANMAAIFAITAAVGFAFWLYVQGRALDDPSLLSSSPSYDAMSTDAMTSAEVEAAAAEAIKGAEEAAAAADKAAGL